MAAYDRGDMETAFKLLKPLAEQGNSHAQARIGVLYVFGLGVPKDFDQALIWSRKAAEQGDSGGQVNLAIMYDNGVGVPQDYAQAVQWYRKAAEQGSYTAAFKLGVKYGKGQGVPQDYVQALMWFYIGVAIHGADTSRVKIDREYLSKQMTTEQIAEAQRLAQEWSAAHAKH